MDKQVLEKILDKIKNKDYELLHEDERGKIWRLEIDNKKYILLYTAKNEVRGGDYHKTKQHDYVLKGRIMWIRKVCLECPDGKGEDADLVRENEEIITEPNVPHMMVSFGEPSLVLEWLEGDFEKQYYAPFRNKIEGKT